MLILGVPEVHRIGKFSESVPKSWWFSSPNTDCRMGLDNMACVLERRFQRTSTGFSMPNPSIGAGLHVKAAVF